MDIDSILAKEPAQLSAEEVAFLESALLEASRQFYREIRRVAADIPDEHRELAEKLESSAAALLLNVESVADPEGGAGRRSS